MENTKISLFAPLIFGVLYIVSFGIMAATPLVFLGGNSSVRGGSVSLIVAFLLFVIAFILGLFLLVFNGNEMPGSIQSSKGIRFSLILISIFFGLLMLGSSLFFYGNFLISSIMLLTGLLLMLILGLMHRIETRHYWYNVMQVSVPFIQGALISAAIILGCLGEAMLLVPFIVLLLLDMAMSILRYQFADFELRRTEGEIVSDLRKSANIAMLLRFATGTVLVALLIGIRPTLLPLAITSMILIDRLLLQVSVIALESHEKPDNRGNAQPISS